jgi:carbamoyl-phosphate synthase large subunit
LGTCFDSIDITEDRKRFRAFAKKIGLKQPKNCFFSSVQEGVEKSQKIGFPMILRPSYVIGGTAIQVIQNEAEFQAYLQNIPLETVAPILMEEFLEGAMEVEVDAICDGKEVFICGIIEHVEPAGIHSGDSICFLSPYQLHSSFQNAIREQTLKIGQALNIIGLFNVQFAIHNDELVVLEVNARASRTIPLLSKTTSLPLVHIATKCILGQSLKAQGLSGMAQPKCLALKMPVFPFSRLHLANEQLGPQMKSTGEVLCVGKTFEELFMKARMYASQRENLYTAELEERLPPAGVVPQLEVYDSNKFFN